MDTIPFISGARLCRSTQDSPIKAPRILNGIDRLLCLGRNIAIRR
jgi:hypothetical protein